MRFKIRRTVFFLVLFTVLLFMVYLHSMLDQQKNVGIVDTSITSTVAVLTLSSHISNTTTINSPCHNLKWPGEVEDKQTFHKVTGKDLYVFSAFYDDVVQNSPILRIIAVQTRSQSGSVKCQVWYEEQHNYHNIIPGRIRRIPEDHGYKYGAIFIMCSLPNKKIPYAVSIITDTCQEPTHHLKVIHFEKKKANFTVCVTPFNFFYSRAYELVEWIEMNRMLGANYFTFYNHSTGVNVDSVLKLYSSKGLVDVVQWHLPMKVDHWPPSGRPEVHYFAQLASLNDCLYRNLHRTDYLVYEDLDEVLMPRQNKTWSALLASMSPKIAAFIFRCSFFRKDWPKLETDFEGKDTALKYKSVFLFNTLRETRQFPYKHRSKYIIVPQKVDTVGIHNIWIMRSGSEENNIPVSQGLLHHYRNWEKPNEKLDKTKDMYMHTFADTLLSRLENIWSHLKGVRLDIPLSEYPSPV